MTKAELERAVGADEPGERQSSAVTSRVRCRSSLPRLRPLDEAQTGATNYAADERDEVSTARVQGTTSNA